MVADFNYLEFGRSSILEGGDIHNLWPQKLKRAKAVSLQTLVDIRKVECNWYDTLGLFIHVFTFMCFFNSLCMCSVRHGME